MVISFLSSVSNPLFTDTSKGCYTSMWYSSIADVWPHQLNHWRFLCPGIHVRLVPRGTTDLPWPRPPRCWGVVITHRHITLGRTPLVEGSACPRDLHPTTHNVQNGHTAMPRAGFKLVTPAEEQPHTYALDRATALKPHWVWVGRHMYVATLSGQFRGTEV